MSEPIDHDELLEGFDSNLSCWEIWNHDSTAHWCGCLNEGKNLEILNWTRNLVEAMIQLKHEVLLPADKSYTVTGMENEWVHEG